ncbi:hypothetical protein ACFL2V_14545 [Pseudomonadota bacterium]
MKEIIIYLLAAVAGITIFGYSIHMFIGGLVSPEVETIAIAAACIIAATVMALMAWDIVKRRRGH